MPVMTSDRELKQWAGNAVKLYKINCSHFWDILLGEEKKS